MAQKSDLTDAENMGIAPAVENSAMGFRRYSLCRMRSGQTFIVIIGVIIVLSFANFMRGNGNSAVQQTMVRDHLSMSGIRELQSTNHGKNRKRIRFDDEDEQPFQICRTPRLSIENDANAFAFYQLPELNCSKADSLFFTRMEGIYLNKTVLAGRSLDRCEYKSINWESDSSYTYSDPLVRKEPPFEMKVKHDFFKVECFLKKDNSEDENKETGNGYKNAARRLLQFNGNTNNIQQVLPNNVGVNRMANTGNVNMNQAYNLGSSNAQMQLLAKNDIAQHLQYSRNGINQNAQNGQVHSNSQFGQNNFRQNQEVVRQPLQNAPQAKNIPAEPPENNIVANNGNQRNIVQAAKPNSENRAPKEAVKDQVEANNPPKNEGNKENDPSQAQNEDNEEPSYDYTHMDEDDQYMMPDVPDFEQYFVQVQRREEVIKRIRDIKPSKYSTQMNVLMFALDSMSHLAYQRKMPKTYKYLKEKLGAVVLNSYNIVGDATTAAIIPMLTGKSVEELPEVRRDEPGSTYVDTYPLIWNRFEQSGYVTLFSEDEPLLGVFNLRFNGFEEIPTDHYMRHFWLASHASNLYDISPRFCLGKTARHEFLMQYMRKFHITYRDVPTFSFNMMTEYTHSNNNPAQYVDEDLVKNLEILEKNKVFENTLLIVFGDHGARYSQVRKTIQGKMEERLPMMSFAFPQWFKEKYPNLIRNLETNANRLTTPFDIYETLRDVLDIKRPETPITFKERGISLLKEIPLNRTCASAGIAMHWCTCMHWRGVEGFESEAKTAAGHIVDLVNTFSEKHRHMCHKLSLKGIEDAKMVFPNEKVLTFMKTIDSDQRIANFSRDVEIDLIHFQIIVETWPNKGLYEATVAYDVAKKSYKVSPDISRINVYGKQASCVEEKLPDLRKYCHCIRKKDEG